MRSFDFEDGDLTKAEAMKTTFKAAEGLAKYTLGMDRCGQVVADVAAFEDVSRFSMKISELQADGGTLQELATWRAEGHINHRVQAARPVFLPTIFDFCKLYLHRGLQQLFILL